MTTTTESSFWEEEDGASESEYYQDDDAYAAAARTRTAVARHLTSYYHNYFYWNSNFTYDAVNVTDFDEQNLVKAQDVSVSSVVASFYFNVLVFVLLMTFYECLRRMLPAVYSSRKRLQFAREGREASAAAVPGGAGDAAGEPPMPSSSPDDRDSNNNKAPETTDSEQELNASLSEQSLLPDDRPLDWIGPVFGVPWNRVRKMAGLDGYFFLRYIRMNVRIAAVSCFWFFGILVPVYLTGGEIDRIKENSNNKSTLPPTGWYYLSAVNVSAHGWRMWMACIFLYLFSGFIFFVVKQEYRHFLELRQDFLARGTIHIHPQHHYSLMVENVPYDLRSDRALKDYFRKLFPNAVHSASVVLKLPDLEEASKRCLRSCRRLEKSIALLHATGQRPTHIVGRGRVSVLGVDLMPLECQPCGGGGAMSMDDDDNVMDHHILSCYSEMADDDDESAPHPQSQQQQLPTTGLNEKRPARGTRVDSISYYTQELAAHSRTLFRMQKRKGAIAESGNQSIQASNWLDSVVREASLVASRIMDDSVQDNALISPADSFDHAGSSSSRHRMAETMSSTYGSINNNTTTTTTTPPTNPSRNSSAKKITVEDAFPKTKSTTSRRRRLDEDQEFSDDNLVSAGGVVRWDFQSYVVGLFW